MMMSIYNYDDVDMLRGTYTNPVASGNDGYADPCVVKDNNVFYAFATNQRVVIAKSTDLINWENCGYAIDDTDYATLCTLTKNATTYVWAPCVIKHGDVWLMYVSVVAGNTATNCHMCVFSSASPEGKWKYRGEITNASSLSLNDCIDAEVVRDSDGKLYMFLGASYGIYMIRLSADGLSIDNTYNKVAIHPHTPSGSNDTRLEASMCYWRNGYYYLLNSAGMYTADGGYHIVVSRSTTLSGAYVNKNGDSLQTASNTGTTIMSGNTSFKSCGHNSNIITDNDGNDWILFHAYPNGEAKRQLCLQRVFWDANGWPYFDGNTVVSGGIGTRF